MNIPDKYSPKETEEKCYKFWQQNGYFHSEPDGRPTYTVLMPPPNVTGILHMGHMLNNTLQDVLVRRARMKGLNTVWIPGTDHASIATEAKVVAKLKAEGISKKEIGREAFLKHAWEWTELYGGTILEQLKKLGCSCDWDRTRFTMEDKMSQQVIRSFVQLYQKDLVYRGFRMLNWDPEAKTNISDEEVIYKEQQGQLFFLKYQIEDSQDFLTVATTRPETIFGDTAVCINPNDERYKHLKGKKVIVPLVGRVVPIIEDEYVDPEFGTGVLKITPAHDVNDYEIGKKHQLQIIDALDNDANLNEHGLHYQGKNRFVVRNEIATELKSKNLLLKAEDYTNKIGTSERTGAVIEPKISIQWFLKMQDIAKPALDVVMNDQIKFHPPKFKNTYKHWMENIRDWNISRQLWWGQQIPAYYFGQGEDDFVVAENLEEALVLAKKKSQNPSLLAENLKKDEDVLDTWFSSWLWPLSVFDGLLEPDNQDIKAYFPSSDLVTGPDIIFFWVARMIMAGLEFGGKIPFENVYFTGIVRDKQRQKMSKSLGNSPDPLELIEKYGADGVRVGILLSSAAGNDLLFDEDLMLQGRNFATKIWNAYKLTQSWTGEQKPSTEADLQSIIWFENQIKKTSAEIEDHFLKFRISDALHSLYKLVWDDFCSWYLESVKPSFGEKIAQDTLDKSIVFFEEILKILHPFMPFLSEELWQNIRTRTIKEALVITVITNDLVYNKHVISDFEFTKEIISAVRTYRQTKGLSFKEKIELHTNSTQLPNETIIKKLANISEIHKETKNDNPSYSFIVGAVEFSIPLNGQVDLEEEKNKLKTELEYITGFLNSVKKKLSNEKFVSGAPKNVVDVELKKQKDAEEKIKLIEQQLNKL